MIKKVTIFCASSTQVKSNYFESARKVGRIIAENQLEILYGAGAVGLMGALADASLKSGGSVTGIIPYFMKELAWAHNHLSDLVVVNDMHERKKQLIMQTDAILALPGGLGTLDELLEAITLKQLGQITVPIVILNSDRFFNPLLSLLEHLIQESFMRPQHRDIWTVIDHPEDLMSALNNAPGWDGSAVKLAQM